MELALNSPVFLSFLYRSGSTLLVLALNQSPELNVSYDTVHFMRFSHGKYLPAAKKFKEIVQDTAIRMKEKWDLELNVKEIITDLEQRPVITEAGIYDQIMRSFLKLSDDQRWLDRSDVCWEGIPGFLEMFPAGKVIHIYRDPRAVLASYKHMTFHPAPMYMDAVFASLAMFNFISSKEIASNPSVCLLKYEELVCHPEKTMRDLCTFLGIDFVPEMLEPGKFIDRFGKPFDSNSSFSGPRPSFDRHSLDLWKKKLRRAEIHFAEMILKEKMDTFGYTLLNPDLTEEDKKEWEKIVHDDFIRHRIKYWEQTGDGQQAFPNTPGAYQHSKQI